MLTVLQIPLMTFQIVPSNRPSGLLVVFHAIRGGTNGDDLLMLIVQHIIFHNISLNLSIHREETTR